VGRAVSGNAIGTGSWVSTFNATENTQTVNEDERADSDGNRVTGTGREHGNRVVTVEWFEKYKVVQEPHIRRQMVILGNSSPTPEQISLTKGHMEGDRALAKEFGRHLCRSMIIAAAQKQNLFWKRQVCRNTNQIRHWWTSLPVEEVPSHAETMFKIQQVPFELDGWSATAEAKFMKENGLAMYRPPYDGGRSSIRKIIVQAKVDVVKSLTDSGKSKHGYYISVRDNMPDETAGSKWRRQKGVWDKRMLRNVREFTKHTKHEITSNKSTARRKVHCEF